VVECVEEVMRYEPPFRMLPPRFSSKATQVDGTNVPTMELGRMETQIALRAFFTRFPRARVLEEPSWRPGLFMRRLHSLPVLLEP
jgi:cytochrome P450